MSLCSYMEQLPGSTSVPKDKFGSLYVIKGRAETYPCLVSHVDRVSRYNHSKDFRAVEIREVAFGYSPKYKRLENLGANGKDGVFIYLEYLGRCNPMEVIFLREEETGCRGSSGAATSFFGNVRLVIQPGRKGNSDLITNMGYFDLYSEGFAETIESEKWGYIEESGLVINILALKERGLEISCLNVSCGYYNAHTNEEIAVKKNLVKSLLFVKHIIEDCTNAYPHTQSNPYFSPHEFEDEIYDILNSNPTLIPEDLYEMYSTDFPHLRPDDYERIYRGYRMFWRECEEYELISDSGYRNKKILSWMRMYIFETKD